MKKEIAVGTIRIQTKNLIPYEKTKTSWKKSAKQFSNVKQIVRLFKAHKKFSTLIDKKDSRFLKGQLYQEKVQGARINILPDGTVIDKAYSLFAKELTVHDQSSDEHWDVLFQNPGGTWSYCYSLEKKTKNTLNKYKKVNQFDQIYLNLIKNVSLALKNKKDNLALPMYTLLRTRMRIGNEIYYKFRTYRVKHISCNPEKKNKLYTFHQPPGRYCNLVSGEQRRRTDEFDSTGPACRGGPDSEKT